MLICDIDIGEKPKSLGGCITNSNYCKSVYFLEVFGRGGGGGKMSIRHDDAAAYAAARGRVREGKQKKRGLKETVLAVTECDDAILTLSATERRYEGTTEGVNN